MAALSRRSYNLLKPITTITPYISHLHRSITTDSTPLYARTKMFSSHNCEPPSCDLETSASELINFFNDMVKMRRMVIAAKSLYNSKLIRGSCHLYDGQEAVAVGMEAAITKKDSIITAFGDHCIFLSRGGTLVECFAELMGRKDGCSKGKGGSLHFYKKDSGFFGGHGIIGAQAPLGIGLAFAQKYNKEDHVSFALYGGADVNHGQLFEALNMAALRDLPAILVCENNYYGMDNVKWRVAKSPAYYKRGDYVPGLKVDGVDVLAVKQACKFAKEHALKNGPLDWTVEVLAHPSPRQQVSKILSKSTQQHVVLLTASLAEAATTCFADSMFSVLSLILQIDTYRYHVHSMSDPDSTFCRRRDEICGFQERDPIVRIRNRIIALEIATGKELKDIEKEKQKEVDEAIAQAKESPMPDPSELFTNVYVKDSRS